MDSHTVLYGVFGDPVRHSKSPLMMNGAFRHLGINAAYGAFHVKPEQLKDAVAGVRALSFRGVNVTIPHKVNVMAELDEVDESARIIGAVNTVVNDDGRLIGYNTDGIGYVRSLMEETGFDPQGKRILVLGAGGAARGVAYALALRQPEAVWIANRSVDKAEALAEALGRYADVRAVESGRVRSMDAEWDLVVNTTSVGMHPDVEGMPLDPDALREGMLVSDLIYNPLQTRLLRQAAERGCRTHGGLGMFVYQGAYAFEYWTGQAAPTDVMREAVLRSLQA